MTTMAAGKFKDQCLKVLDRVAATRSPVTITKRGRPVAAVVPFIAPAEPPDTLASSILEEHGDPSGTGEAWDAARS